MKTFWLNKSSVRRKYTALLFAAIFLISLGASQTVLKDSREYYIKGSTVEVEKTYTASHPTKGVILETLPITTTLNDGKRLIKDYKLYNESGTIYEESLVENSVQGRPPVILEPNESVSESFTVPQDAYCKPKFYSVPLLNNTYIELPDTPINEFPLRICDFRVSSSPHLYATTTEIEVYLPNRYDYYPRVTEFSCPSYSASIETLDGEVKSCNIDYTKEKSTPVVDVSSKKWKVVTFEPITSNQSQYIRAKQICPSIGEASGCKFNFAFQTSSYIRFIFWTSLAIVLLSIGYVYKEGEKWESAIKTIIGLWTFQMALIPLTGFSRPMEISLYDLTILLIIPVIPPIMNRIRPKLLSVTGHMEGFFQELINRKETED